MQTKKTVHITDLKKDKSYIERIYPVPTLVDQGGARTILNVPMVKHDELIGVINLYRKEVWPFTEEQIELVRNFAAQAVIAIENTRLLNETKEALEQQRASTEVLNVISNSVSDAQPVFEKIVESCERLFATSRIGLNLIGPDGLVHAGAYGKFADAEKLRRENFPHPVPGSATGAVISSARPIQYPDALSDSDVPEYGRRAAKVVGFRAFVMAPLLSKGRGVGAIFVGRETAGLFSDTEIALLKTFAAQAVIAIENTRLLNELRQRTDDLTESLEQQTATSEVLGVISRSPGELEPVFQTMLENAVRICDAKFGTLFRCENESFEAVALYGVPVAHADFLRQRGLSQPIPGSGLDLLLQTKDVVRMVDASAEAATSAAARLGGARSHITVPMLKDNVLIGAISIYRQVVRPFTDKQIELVENFAAQAVIAIENTRLLNQNCAEGQLEQQRRQPLKVLSVISSSPGELEPVFQTMLANAVRICDAKFGTLFRYDNESFDAVAHFGVPPAFADFSPGAWSVTTECRKRSRSSVADQSRGPHCRRLGRTGPGCPWQGLVARGRLSSCRCSKRMR